MKTKNEHGLSLKEELKKRKQTKKIISDVNKVSKVIEKVGPDKQKVKEHLMLKYDENETNRLIQHYTQMLEFEDWKD